MKKIKEQIAFHWKHIEAVVAIVIMFALALAAMVVIDILIDLIP